MAPKLNSPCASRDSTPAYCSSCSARRRFSRSRKKRSIAWIRIPAQLLAVPRLGDVAVDAPEVDGLDQHVDVGEGGDDDADGVRADRAQGLQQVQAGHARHALVGHDDRDVFRAGQLQRLLAAVGQPQGEHLAEVEAERVQVVRLVVDDEDGKLG